MRAIAFCITAAVLQAVAAFAQPSPNPADEPRGPSSGMLPSAPLVSVSEPVPLAEAAGESGQLYSTGHLPPNSTGAVQLLRFRAPGAAAYRLYFEGLALPERARLFMYGLDNAGQVTATFGPYEANGPLDTGSFRSRIIPGVEAVIEIQNAQTLSWPMHIPWVASIGPDLLSELRAQNDAGLTETANQRKAPEGRQVQVDFNGRLVTAQVIGDDLVIEGDLVIGRAADLVPGEKDSQTPERFAVVRTEPSGHWPAGVVPFENPGNDPRVNAALATWKTLLNGMVSFIPRTAESSFVRFVSTSDNVCSTSVVGRSGTSIVRLGPLCSSGSARHEIGHVLGFHHEQQRIDRDNYVKIHWENIPGDKQHNFEGVSGPANTDIGPYDFCSIMHYPLNAFSSNGKDTIEPKVAVPPCTIGQGSAPSTGDVAAVKQLYGVRLSASVRNLPASGGASAVLVFTQTDRVWVATEDADWVTITSGQAGQGDGTVQFVVAPNSQPFSRSTTLSIRLAPEFKVNATLTITQTALGCTYSVSPLVISAGPDQGSYPITVTTAPGCTWGASEALPWVLSISPVSSQGTGTVSVLVQPNNAATHNAPRRTGTVTVADKVVTIVQEGGCVLCP